MLHTKESQSEYTFCIVYLLLFCCIRWEKQERALYNTNEVLNFIDIQNVCKHYKIMRYVSACTFTRIDCKCVWSGCEWTRKRSVKRRTSRRGRVEVINLFIRYWMSFCYCPCLRPVWGLWESSVIFSIRLYCTSLKEIRLAMYIFKKKKSWLNVERCEKSKVSRV